MAERNRLIGIAIAAAFGVGSFAALRYNRSFEKTAEVLREQILNRVATEINYNMLKDNQDALNAFCQQIPGEWKISHVLSEVIAEPASYWRQLHALRKSLFGPGSSSFQEVRPADYKYLGGLYVYREQTENPGRTTRFFGDSVTTGRETSWLIGPNYLPREIRPSPR